jgi:hypothetical protein
MRKQIWILDLSTPRSWISLNRMDTDGVRFATWCNLPERSIAVIAIVVYYGTIITALL